jgi:hypothetical protein
MIERRVEISKSEQQKQTWRKSANLPYPICYSRNRERKNKRHPSGGVFIFECTSGAEIWMTVRAQRRHGLNPLE